MKCKHRIVKETYYDFVCWYVEKKIVLNLFWFTVSLGYARISETFLTEDEAMDYVETLCSDPYCYFEYKNGNYKQNNIL